MGNRIIEIFYKEGVFDATNEIIRHGIADLGVPGIESVVVTQLYSIDGTMGDKEITSLCGGLLADPVTQSYRFEDGHSSGPGRSVKVWYKPGVTDATGESVLKAAEDMGIRGIEKVHTGSKYMLCGNISEEDIKKLCERLLANTVIQIFEIGE
jgi:phosphoribosylformylglycinamidine synthase subunit PurS